MIHSSTSEHAKWARFRAGQAAARFLMVDLDVANLLLDSALLAADSQYTARALQTARTAHRTMVGLLRRLELSEEELDEVIEGLDRLDFRLDMHGV
jgi:hypothetical protein